MKMINLEVVKRYDKQIIIIIMNYESVLDEYTLVFLYIDFTCIVHQSY